MVHIVALCANPSAVAVSPARSPAGVDVPSSVSKVVTREPESVLMISPRLV